MVQTISHGVLLDAKAVDKRRTPELSWRLGLGFGRLWSQKVGGAGSKLFLWYSKSENIFGNGVRIRVRGWEYVWLVLNVIVVNLTAQECCSSCIRIRHVWLPSRGCCNVWSRGVMLMLEDEIPTGQSSSIITPGFKDGVVWCCCFYPL